MTLGNQNQEESKLIQIIRQKIATPVKLKDIVDAIENVCLLGREIDLNGPRRNTYGDYMDNFSMPLEFINGTYKELTTSLNTRFVASQGHRFLFNPVIVGAGHLRDSLKAGALPLYSKDIFYLIEGEKKKRHWLYSFFGTFKFTIPAGNYAYLGVHCDELFNFFSSSSFFRLRDSVRYVDNNHEAIIPLESKVIAIRHDEIPKEEYQNIIRFINS